MSADQEKESFIAADKADAQSGGRTMSLSESSKARGEPGEKQPAHKDTRTSAEETVAKVQEVLDEQTTDTYESSAKRAESGGGNINPTPPHERTAEEGGDQSRALVDQAAGSISAARSAMAAQEIADERLKSDPRYERDQKVFELGRTGQLGKVPPSKAEQIARYGNLSDELREAIPATAEEQVAEDEKRLEVATKSPEERRDYENQLRAETKNVPARDDTQKRAGSGAQETGGVRTFGTPTST